MINTKTLTIFVLLISIAMITSKVNKMTYLGDSKLLCPKKVVCSDELVSDSKDPCIVGEYDQTKMFLSTKDHKIPNTRSIKQCPKDQYCPFYPGNLEYFPEEVCVDRNKNIHNRYHGESCNTDIDCSNDLWYHDDGSVEIKGKCIDGFCAGSQEGSKCDNTGSCVLGLYCDTSIEDKYACKPLKKEGEECLYEFDCENNLFCNDSKCTALFTLKTGTVIVPDGLYQTEDRLCESGVINYINDEDRACVEEYYDRNHHKESDIDENGFIKCNAYDESCHYLYVANDKLKIKEKKKCDCGMNPEGQGYCPLAKNEEKAKKRFNYFKNTSIKLYNLEGVHSAHRGLDDKLDSSLIDVDLFKCLYYHDMPSYYKAEKCVLKSMTLDLDQCGFDF